MHQKADREELERLVSDVREFVSTIPADTGKDWEDDLGIAVKGILVRKREVVPVLQRKPELQVEDEDDYSYMYD